MTTLATLGDVSLRAYQDDHVAQTVLWLNQPELRKDFGLSATITEQSHRTWLAEQADLTVFAIYFKEIYVGNITLRINKNHKKAYYEMYLGDQSQQGKGIGKRSLQCLLEYAFVRLGLHRVYLHAFANSRAEQLYKSVGFMLEGTERDSVYLDDHFQDLNTLAILQGEWQSTGTVTI